MSAAVGGIAGEDAAGKDAAGRGGALDADVQVTRDGFVLDARVQAAAGETIALMGPSGAGKSTLLGAIAGFTALTSGAVRLDGATVQDAAGIDVPPRERGVILLGQQARLFPYLSARENIAFGLRARRVPKARARDRADAWLERVGLAGLGDRRPALLSGGQQQRVALARALATSPRVVLLDEPLNSLDPATADGIRSLLREELAAAGTTAVLATHDVADARALAARLVVLERGSVTAVGTPDEVLGAPVTPFVAALAASGAGADRESTRASAGPSRALADSWQARVERLEVTADGIRVHASAADGIQLELHLPDASPVVPGSIISIRPPS